MMCPRPMSLPRPNGRGSLETESLFRAESARLVYPIVVMSGLFASKKRLSHIVECRSLR